MSDPVVVMITFKVKPDLEELFMAELSTIRALVINEPECLDFIVLRSSDQSSTIRVFETWTSRAYFDNEQMHKSYYAPYLARVSSMWTEPRDVGYWRVDSSFRRDLP